MKPREDNPITISPALLAEIREAADEERRPAGDLLREAVERYLENRCWQRLFVYGEERARTWPYRGRYSTYHRGIAARACARALSDRGHGRLQYLHSRARLRRASTFIFLRSPARLSQLVLECAVATSSQFIVTGDNHLSHLDHHSGIQIVKVADLMKLLPSP